MRMRNITLFVFGLMAILNAGCGWFGSSQPTGGVAVVDLDEIARQVGASQEIAQALKASETSLNTQLRTMKMNYVQQLQERKTLYGDQPTAAQNEQLVSISRQVNLNLANAQRQAAGQLSAHRSSLIVKFREQVSPIAQEIARQRGLSLVVPKNDGWLLAVDDAVNITDEVAASLKITWQPIITAANIEPQVSRVVSNPAETTNDPHAGGVQPAGHYEPAPQGQ